MVPQIFTPGIYKVRGLFWVCQTDDNNLIYVTNKDVMNTTQIEITSNTEIEKFVDICLTVTNPMLKEYLTKNNWYHWIPMWKMTIDYNEDTHTFEICYYQDKRIHDTIYRSSRIYIMVPIPSIIDGLDKYYYPYGLDYEAYQVKSDLEFPPKE
jgi:hypothetical protein